MGQNPPKFDDVIHVTSFRKYLTLFFKSDWPSTRPAVMKAVMKLVMKMVMMIVVMSMLKD